MARVVAAAVAVAALALTGWWALAARVVPAGAANALPSAASCTPTPADMLGPFYKPNAPVRSRVGSGHELRGTVRSAATCGSLSGVRVEFWMAGPDAEYRDDYRATVVADPQGQYRFESHVPPGYAGRPPHIHVRVAAAGYQTFVTQYYPKPGQTSGVLDLVLVPAR